MDGGAAAGDAALHEEGEDDDEVDVYEDAEDDGEDDDVSESAVQEEAGDAIVVS